MKKTLLINSSWEPLMFVDEKKVISLMMRNKIEIMSYWEGTEFIPSMNLELPAVIKLHKYVKRKFNIPRFCRKAIFSRDNLSCQYCMVTLSFNTATIDHVVPKSLGGKTEWENCVTSCFDCNGKKSNKMLDNFNKKLIKKPVPPSLVDFCNIKTTNTIWHSDWYNIIC